MIKLGYNSFDFGENNLPDFVASITPYQYGKKITLKDAFATGDYKILAFENGFFAYVSNYILNQDFELELSVANKDYVAIHINQITAGIECKISLNHKTVSYDDKVITAIFLTTAADSFVLSGSSGACINRLKIMVPKKWLAEALPASTESMLTAYLDLGEDRIYLDAVDTTYRSMVDKVMNTEDNPFYLSVTQNIVAVIAERFFSRLSIKLQKNQKGNELSGWVA